MNHVRRAIQAVGGRKALAVACGVSYQAVQRWERSGSLPAERVLEVENATGVSRHDLRPDLYPRDNVDRAQAVG